MTLRVDVLQHHIDAGLRRDCRLCPIAFALQRATGETWTVTVMRGWRNWDLPSATSVRFPAEVTMWMRRFDAGEECRPFSFAVEVPDVPI